MVQMAVYCSINAKKLIRCYLAFGILLLLSCQKTPPPVDPTPQVDWSDSITQYGSAALGLDLYLDRPDLNGRSCVNCHLSPTGFDLVFFGKSDTRAQDSIIIQRAVFDPQTGHGHVSVEDAYHIAAYLRSLRISTQTIPNDNASSGALMAIIQASVSTIQIAYSFEYTFTDIQSYTAGGHFIALRKVF